MKRIRIRRWTPTQLTFLTVHTTPCFSYSHARPFHILLARQAKYLRNAFPPYPQFEPEVKDNKPPTNAAVELEHLPSPPYEEALKSAKLAALHSRLGLPKSLPLQTLARTLVDVTADASPQFNNSALATLGGDLLGYYTSEHLICHYPRLPLAVLFAAQRAYVGPEALAAITKEWGVDPVAAPGGEVDPGLLQFRREEQSAFQPHIQKRELQQLALAQKPVRARMDGLDAVEEATEEPNELWDSRGHRIQSSGKIIMYDDAFSVKENPEPVAEGEDGVPLPVTSLENASKNFVRAVIGSIYLHLGRTAAKTFFKEHFMSRSLDLAKLFSFKWPQNDLSRLCLREGLEPPIARLISETGRLSAHPAFVVGVYSGREKLGEGVGASIDEGKWRAAAAALKGWYLYSPMDVVLPSEVEGGVVGKKWKPNMVDCGEIIT
jgi:dsRNA-specific ribonuclease